MTADPIDKLETYRGYLRSLAELQLNPRLQSKEDASDVVQLTLLQAHQDLPTFRGKTDAALRAWLKTILDHQIINLVKRYKTKKRDHQRELSIDQQLQQSTACLAALLQVDQSSPSQQLMKNELIEQLVVSLGNLLEEERIAIILKHVHGWRVARIAEYLGRTEDGVGGLLRRGLRKLRSEFPFDDSSKHESSKKASAESKPKRKSED